MTDTAPDADQTDTASSGRAESRSRLTRKLAAASGVVAGLTSLAGCSSSESNTDSTTDEDPSETHNTATTDTEMTTTSTTTSSVLQVDAFGGVSFDKSGAMFVELKKDVSLDLIVLNGPFGQRVGVARPGKHETTAKFRVLGQQEQMYTPGTYTVRGYKAANTTTESDTTDYGGESGSGSQNTYQQVAVKDVPLEPKPEIVTVESAGDREKMRVVIGNAGTGFLPVNQIRVRDPNETGWRRGWTDTNAVALPDSPAKVTVGRETKREISDDTSEAKAKDKYCNGEIVKKRIEARANYKSSMTASRTVRLSLSGEAIVEKTWGPDYVYCPVAEEAGTTETTTTTTESS